MPGVETNLGELLLTAAETTPDDVCLEVEAESYTFAQARQKKSIFFTFSNHEFGQLSSSSFNTTLIEHTFPKVDAFFAKTMLTGFEHLHSHVVRSCFAHSLMLDP